MTTFKVVLLIHTSKLSSTLPGQFGVSPSIEGRGRQGAPRDEIGLQSIRRFVGERSSNDLFDMALVEVDARSEQATPRSHEDRLR
jgi:hypothetical protein